MEESTAIVEGTVSSTSPPLLDTHIASAPCFKARIASSLHIIPLITIGREVIFLISSIYSKENLSLSITLSNLLVVSSKGV
jgi:hypothetical protein